MSRMEFQRFIFLKFLATPWGKIKGPVIYSYEIIGLVKDEYLRIINGHFSPVLLKTYVVGTQ